MDKFDYLDFDTVTVDGRRHYVITDELRLPSITSVLGACQSAEKRQALEAWRARIGEAEAARVSDEAKRRGTALHALAENFILGREAMVEGATEADVQLFNTIRPLLRKHITDVYGLEKVLFSTELGIAGRCDGIVEWDGVPSIIDYKTMSRPKRADEIDDYWIQATFYSVAHDEMFGTDINQVIIIGAVVGGLPLVFKQDRRAWLEPLLNVANDFHARFSR